jgi:hypothetical protein
VTTYRWSEVREMAVKAFGGEAPLAQTEQDVFEEFEQNPSRVIGAIPHIGRQVSAGTIRSGWAVLRARMVEPEHEPLEAEVSDTVARQRRISHAEQWLRAAGLHFDRWEEVQDDLFGERGQLRPWAGDPILIDRFLTLWLEQRKVGERVEQAAQQRADENKAIRRRLALKIAAERKADSEKETAAA